MYMPYHTALPTYRRLQSATRTNDGEDRRAARKGSENAVGDPAKAVGEQAKAVGGQAKAVGGQAKAVEGQAKAVGGQAKAVTRVATAVTRVAEGHPQTLTDFITSRGSNPLYSAKTPSERTIESPPGPKGWVNVCVCRAMHALCVPTI